MSHVRIFPGPVVMGARRPVTSQVRVRFPSGPRPLGAEQQKGENTGIIPYNFAIDCIGVVAYNIVAT